MMKPHSIFQDTMDFIHIVGGSLQSIGEHVTGEGSAVCDDDYEDEIQQHQKGDIMVPFKSSCDEDDDENDVASSQADHQSDSEEEGDENDVNDENDEDDMNSTLSLGTATSCSTTSTTSLSVCSTSTSISTLQTRESQAMDTLYERMQDIFRYLQNSGIADASICELKQQLFSQHDTLLALERTQEYMALVCPNEQKEEKLNCIILLEQAWNAGLTLLTLQHKCCFRQLHTQKNLMSVHQTSTIATDSTTLEYISQTQSKLCLQAEQVTKCQTRLYKLKSLRQRLEYNLSKCTSTTRR